CAGRFAGALIWVKRLCPVVLRLLRSLPRAAGEGWGGANDGVAASAPSVPPHPGLPPQAGEGEEQSARIASREVLHNPDRCLTQVKVNRCPPADDFADLYRRLPQHGFDTQAMDRTGTPVDQF